MKLTKHSEQTENDVALVMAFLVSENKNRSVEGLPPSDFYLNRFVLSVRRKSGVEYKTSTPSLRGLIS